MPEQMEDLWPSKFPTSFEDPEPVKILKGQANLLADKTDGVVEGVVVESTIEATVFYSLYLTAPALGDYMFKLLFIAISLSDIQAKSFPPVDVQHSFGGEKKRITSPEEFKGWLRSVLQSESVQGVVGSMIRRSTRRVSS
jgi:hypothetical protein